MQSIPLTRARHASNFAIALQRQGVSAEAYLDQCRLPRDLPDTVGGECMISAVSLLDFAEKSATDTGIHDLGYWAGKLPIGGYGSFGVGVVLSPTLYSAIDTFCSTVRSECSEADYYLTFDRNSAWFCHGLIGTGLLQQQHELYALAIMLQVVQLALGEDWSPARLRLLQTDENRLSMNDFLLGSNIEFGASATGIEIPLADLATKLADTKVGASIDGVDRSLNDTDDLPSDPLIILQDLIAAQIRLSRKPTIELAAEVTGVTKRTLQRYLGSKVTTYTKLVGQVRFKMAMPQLRDDSLSISSISHDLGYSNIAHFSRAVSRMTGLSPRAYRSLLKR